LIDLNEIIREMVVLLRDMAHRDSISIRSEFDPALPAMNADRVQLQQVLMNLMLNGIEAMKESGELMAPFDASTLARVTWKPVDTSSIETSSYPSRH